MSLVKLGRFSRCAGWLACLSAVLVVVAAVLLILMYYYALTPSALAPGGASLDNFSHILNLVGLFASALTLPLPVALHRFTGHSRWDLGWNAMTLGVLGWLTICVTQALLIIAKISFEVTEPFALVGLTMVGAWMILANHLARAGGALERWLPWLGELIGVSFVLAVVAIVLSLVSDALIGTVFALAIPSALALIVGFPVWLIGLGRKLLDPQMTPAPSSQRPASVGAP